MKVRVFNNVKLIVDGTAVTLRGGVQDLDDKVAKAVIAGKHGEALQAPVEPKEPAKTAAKPAAKAEK